MAKGFYGPGAGRPKVEVDLELAAKFCRANPKITQADLAVLLEVSTDVLASRIKEAEGLTFSQFRDKNGAHTRRNLIQRAIQKAVDGDNTMLIFCLKNLCGWADKQETNDDRRPVVHLQYSLGGEHERHDTDRRRQEAGSKIHQRH